jgi:hypothetical protein
MKTLQQIQADGSKFLEFAWKLHKQIFCEALIMESGNVVFKGAGYWRNGSREDSSKQLF